MMNRFVISSLCAISLVCFALTVVNAAPLAPSKDAPKKDAPAKNRTDLKLPGNSETFSSKTIIAPEHAAEYLGKQVVVEMTVALSNNRDDKSPCFLNSKKDRRDEKNFTAIIFPDGLKKFKDAKIDDPAIHFFNKKVRVTGTIELYKEKPQIKITDPKQIEIVEESAK